MARCNRCGKWLTKAEADPDREMRFHKDYRECIAFLRLESERWRGRVRELERALLSPDGADKLAKLSPEQRDEILRQATDKVFRDVIQGLQEKGLDFDGADGLAE